MTSTLPVEELDITQLHRAISEEGATCEEVVNAYLARIDSWERSEPSLGSLVTLNPRLVDQARNLDRMHRRTGRLTGPLHGVTVIVKDQFETVDMPTTFGSAAMRNYQPTEDAVVVKKLCSAGALIIGKSAMPDFATSFFSTSSLTGRTRNPYAPDWDSGGSSSGTGAAVAANLAAVGIGEDTNGSIRVPASFNCLVGVRVTTGLISRTGMLPGILFQDTPGPMTRTVEDAARLLDVLVGFDADDPYTSAATIACQRRGYQLSLQEEDAPAVVGVLRPAFGLDTVPRASAVNQVMETAIQALQEIGARIVDPFDIPALADHIECSAIPAGRIKHDVNRFLSSRPAAPWASMEQVYRASTASRLNALFVAAATATGDLERDPDYLRRVVNQQDFRRTVVCAMAGSDVDVIAYPTVQITPPAHDEIQEGAWTSATLPTNTTIAARTALPAITVPAGFTAEGLPVGVEFLGRPYGETALLKLAFSFERHTGQRHPPLRRSQSVDSRNATTTRRYPTP